MTKQDFCRTFIDAVRKGDFETLAPMMTADFVCHEADGLPYGGEYRGLDGWQRLLKRVVETWAGFRLETLAILGETADTIVLRFRLVGRSRRTGTPFDTTVMELWRFEDGKLAEIWPYYWDTAELARIA
jgi:uncharacterized protein